MRKILDMDGTYQISNGLTETSADGAALAYDKKYGIMFCAYIPGDQGHYGESRGRVSLAVFPATQPANLRTVVIAEGDCVYTPTALSLGEGCVRVFYERNSRADCDHFICYRDYDFLRETLSEEKTVFISYDGVHREPMTASSVFAYLDRCGCHGRVYRASEQLMIAAASIFRHTDGLLYGTITSFIAEPILYRSRDNLATLEPFAVCPYPAQYEADYKILNGKIYMVERTAAEENSIVCVQSADGGKTWSEPVPLSDSIQCRPRLILYHGHVATLYNYYCADTGHRPAIQQGRTSVRILYGEAADPNENTVIADLYSKYGIVNCSLYDLMDDLYLAYSTSIQAMEYQNGNPLVRGKDAIRYCKLGDLIP